jgi:hypothetical protein
VAGLYRRNDRLYFQTRVSYSGSPVKIPLAAENLREADREIIETQAKLNKGWRYQDANWIEAKDVETHFVEPKPVAKEARDEKSSGRITDYSFKSIFSKWQEIKQSRVRDSSRRCSEDDLQAWEGAFRDDGISDIRKVTRRNISDILNKWEASKGEYRISRHRMKKRLATLRRVFRWLKVQEVIADIPWDSDDASEWIGETEEQQYRPLITKEQVATLIKAARNRKSESGGVSFGSVLADILETMTHTGLRKMEAFTLTWRQIDFERKQVVVEKEKKQQKGTQRAIPFLGGNNEAEKFFVGLRETAKKTGSYAPNNFVFRGRCKEEAPIKNLTGLLIKTAERVGLKNFAFDKNRAEKQLWQSPHLGFHDIRRFFITKCLNSGVEANIIATWVGHKDGGRLIRETYTKYDQSVGREMAKLVKY